MERLRLFIALELPAELKEGLTALQSRLRTCGADVRWVRPEGIHLTLKFLGETEASLVDPLSDGMSRAAEGTGVLSLEARGAGAFPNLARPRVLWVGLGGDLDALRALQERVEQEAVSLGFPPEGRKFSPHLTLGRVRSPRKRERLIEAIGGEAEVKLGRFDTDRLILYRSRLRPSGAEYTHVREASLR